MSNEDSPERKKAREEALEKWRKENNIEDSEDDQEKPKKKATEINIQVESKTNLEQSKLWNTMLTDLKKAYEGIGKPDFDPESIKNQEDMQFHFDTVARLQKAQKAKLRGDKKEPPSSGMPLTASQYGDDSVIPANWEDIPLDLIPFSSEEQMIKTLRKEARQNFNLQRKAEATKLLEQLYEKSAKENQTWELESPLADTQKTEFDEAGQPIGRKKYRLVRKR